MTSRFLVTAAIPDPGIPMLRAAGSVDVLDAPPSYDELRELCASGRYDSVLTQLGDRIDAALLSEARVHSVSNYAVGYNNIDVEAAAARGISVGHTPGVLTDATADIAMLLILGAARRAVEGDRMIREGRFGGWRPDLLLGQDVSGAVLGLAGFGRIARATARRALAFGMRVIFSPRPPADRAVSDAELGEFAGRVEHVDWNRLLSESDFLSLHVPLTDETRHLVDAGALQRMKRTAVLVNTSRGAVVDERALVDSLRTGQIAAAGLDVYEDEPHLAPGLTELKQTLLLPHLGSATVRVRAEMARLAASNAIAGARRERLPHPVPVVV